MLCCLTIRSRTFFSAFRIFFCFAYDIFRMWYGQSDSRAHILQRRIVPNLTFQIVCLFKFFFVASTFRFFFVSLPLWPSNIVAPGDKPPAPQVPKSYHLPKLSTPRELNSHITPTLRRCLFCVPRNVFAANHISRFDE